MRHKLDDKVELVIPPDVGWRVTTQNSDGTYELRSESSDYLDSGIDLDWVPASWIRRPRHPVREGQVYRDAEGHYCIVQRVMETGVVVADATGTVSVPESDFEDLELVNP